MPSKRPDLKLSQKEYARKYHQSIPTIKRWYAKGLPLDDSEAMRRHIRKKFRPTRYGKIKRAGRRTLRPDLKLSQKEYALKYNQSIATIKRWYAKGLPMDDPEAMNVYLLRGTDQPIIDRQRRLAQSSLAYPRENAFQDKIGSILRDRWILHVREFQLPGTQLRGDFLLQKYAVECKVTTVSAIQAIGQLFIYKRTTGRMPILLVPDDVRLARHFVETIEAIPAMFMHESQFRKLFASQKPVATHRPHRSLETLSGEQQAFEF